jgi:hypothetical protein
LKKVDSYAQLEALGRQRLSQNFLMRDFLYSEIAAWYQLRNVPDFPDRAIESGRMLCTELLEPLQAAFGRIHIRSGYRSPLVNGFGNEHGMNCASNENNFAGHIWDYPDKSGGHGATACIVIPWLVDHIANGGNWTDMAWWIHDHLDYSTLYFFPKLASFNISWHERPIRQIDSYVEPRGCLTRPEMSNHGGLHEDQYSGFPDYVKSTSAQDASRSHEGHGELADARGAELLAPRELTDSLANDTNASINYRAIHSRTGWRKAFNHKSIDSALNGVNGAAGLFAGKARIDYGKHGEPRYVIVWATGQETGYLVRPVPGSQSELSVVPVPVAMLFEFDARGGAEVSWIERHFTQSLNCRSDNLDIQI